MFRKSLKAAVCVLAAGTALAACGPVKPGAAAIVGHDRITGAKLDATVTQWSKELPKYPDLQQRIVAEQQQQQQQKEQNGEGQAAFVPVDPSSPSRSALSELVDMRVWDQVARDLNVSITPGQVDSLIAAAGGSHALDPVLLMHGLPTSYQREYVSRLLVQQSLFRSYGVAIGQQLDPQRERQFTTDYAAAARKLGVKINPRYGSFHPSMRIFQEPSGATLYEVTALGLVCPRLTAPDSGVPDSSAGEVKCLEV